MKKWSGLFALCFAQVFVIYDFQMGELFIKPLVADFDAGYMQILHFKMNYLLMFACFSIIASYFGLFWGWKKVLRVGIFLFLISQSLIFFANKIELILFARLLSGLGAACVVPSIISLAMAIYKDLNERALVFAVFGSVFAYFQFEALFIVDYILQQYGVRGTYLFLIFLGITSYVVLFIVQDVEKPKVNNFVMDTKGTVLIVLFIFMLLFGLSRAPLWGVLFASSNAPIRVFWFLSPAFFIIVFAKFSFMYFLKHEIVFEKKHNIGLMPTSLFKNFPVLIGLIQVGIVFAFLAGPMYLLSEYLKHAMELSSRVISGIISVYSCAAVLFFIAMPLFILKKFTARKIFIFGTIAGTIGSFFVFYSIGVESFNTKTLYIGLVFFAFNNASILVLSCLLIASNIGQRDVEQMAGTMVAYKNVLSIFVSSTTALILSLIMGVTFRVNVQDTKMSEKAQVHFKEFTIVKALTNVNEFLSDAKAEREAEELGFSESDAQAFVEYNKEFRAYSIAKAIIFIGLLFLFTLFFARKIPQKILLGRKK